MCTTVVANTTAAISAIARQERMKTRHAPTRFETYIA